MWCPWAIVFVSVFSLQKAGFISWDQLMDLNCQGADGICWLWSVSTDILLYSVQTHCLCFGYCLDCAIRFLCSLHPAEFPPLGHVLWVWNWHIVLSSGYVVPFQQNIPPEITFVSSFSRDSDSLTLCSVTLSNCFVVTTVWIRFHRAPVSYTHLTLPTRRTV